MKTSWWWGATAPIVFKILSASTVSTPPLKWPHTLIRGKQSSFIPRNASDFTLDPSGTRPDPRKKGPRAITGFPLKGQGALPPRLVYLDSPRAAELENLSRDLFLAARSALLAMIDHISHTYNLTPEQAYIVASVAVDLRIGQVFDAPNVEVSAVLPLDIFIDQE